MQSIGGNCRWTLAPGKLPDDVTYHGIALASAAVVVGDGGAIWTTATAAGNAVPPSVTGVPASGVAFVGQSLSLQIPASAGAAYQWYLNGTAIAGASSPTLLLTNLPLTAGGNYAVATVLPTSSSLSSTTLNVKPIADFSVGLVDRSFNYPGGGDPPQLALLATGAVLLNGQQILNPDGSIQASASTGTQRPSQVIPQPDGKWLNLTRFIDAAGDMSLIRYNPDASTDATFAIDSSLLDFTSSLALLPDGRLVLFSVSIANQRVTWRRLLSNGSVDPTFAVQSLAVSSPAGIVLPAVDASGRVYFAVVVTSNSEFAVMPTLVFRLGAAQALDPAFAVAPSTFAQLTVNQIQPVPGGLLYVGEHEGPSVQLGLLDLTGQPWAGYAPRTLVYESPCALQSDGTAIALVPSASQTSGRCFNLQRYTPTGQWDGGDGGRLVCDPSPTLGFSSSSDSIDSLLVLPNGQLLVEGVFQSINLAPAADLARLTPDTDYFATRLVNAATRGLVTPFQNLVMAGYLGGAATNSTIGVPFLFRAAGPALRPLGVADALPKVTLDLYAAQTHVANNTGWSSNPSASAIAALSEAVGAFPFATGSFDSAAIQNLGSGPFFAEVSNLSLAGSALAEAYDAGAAPATVGDLRISNFSCLDVTQAGEPLILGFVLAGANVKSVLIRAVGPGLGAVGVPSQNALGVPLLAQPVLTVYQGSNVIASNQSIGTLTNNGEFLTVSDQVGAFALPSDGPDSGLLLALPAGDYTAVASGAGNTGGTVLLEVYEVP